MRPLDPSRHRFHVCVAGAVVAGALVRLIYLLQVRDNPFFTHPIADAAHFDRWAAQIAGGDLLGSGPFFRPPLYAYLLGLLYWLLGRDFVAVRIVQHAIGLLGIIATAELARRLWNDRVGVIAAWLLALYPTVIYYEGEVLSDFLLVTITPLLLLMVLSARPHDRGFAVSAAGLLTGLFAITRPTVLATVPVLIAWLVRDCVRSGRWRQALVRIAQYGLGLVLVIAPVALRNVVVGHDFVWIAWQGGVNFAVGNRPGADGVSAALPPWGTAWTAADITAAAEAACGHTLKPSEVSEYWTGQGWRFWRDSPGAALPLLGRKLLLFWQNAEYANNQSREWFISRWGPVLHWLPLGFGLLVAAGAIGWWTVRHSGAHRWVVLWTIVYSLAVALFFVTDRFRLPIVPIWMGAAAAGLLWLWDKGRKREWRFLLPVAAIAMLLWIVGRIDFFHLSTESLPRSYLALGNIQLESGRIDAAVASYDTALAIDPNCPGLWLGRGAAFYRAGQVDSAAASFRRELRLHPDNPRAGTNLAIVQLDLGDTLAAMELLNRALSAQPHYLPAALAKARVLRSQGSPDLAYETLDRIGGEASDADASLLAGVLLLEMGRWEAADLAFARVVEARGRTRGAETSPDVPHLLGASTSQSQADLALAHYNRGVIAGLRSRWRDAVLQLEAATSFNPRLAQAWSNLSTAYLLIGQRDSAVAAASCAVQLAPGNPIYLCTRAASYLALADTVAALADTKAALATDSVFAPARGLLWQMDVAPR
jgi:tetratricopeptide (TPR) repeat protein